jgi:hypothetical protein
MTTELEAATKTLNELLDERDQLVARASRLVADRQAIAFAAHARNDKSAKEKLRRINDESVLHNAELESIDAAILESRRRLEVASAAEAIEADKANAEQLRTALNEFVETGTEIDLAFQDLAAHAAELQKILDRIHSLGCQSPSSEQMRVFGEICARTALMQTPWKRCVEIVAPPNRKTFKALIDGWAAQIENNVNARLGETKPEEQAA